LNALGLSQEARACHQQEWFMPDPTLYAARAPLAPVNQASGVPDRAQFLADLDELLWQCPDERRYLVMIDAVDTAWAHDMTLAMGLSPFESLMRCIAGRLVRLLAGQAIIYHIGVKRFAFVMDGDYLDLDAYLDTLIRALRCPSVIEGIPVRPTVRAGITPFRTTVESAGDVLRQAMYAAELAVQDGRVWAWYDPVRDSAYRRAFNLASDVNMAMSSGQLRLVFQPRFALPEGDQVSAEALLRWDHPRLGPVSPDEFIPVLEKNGLIHGVTRWVIDSALAMLAQWPVATLTKLSLNLSPQDFDGHDITAVIHQACLKHRIDPNRLEVEITEGEWLRSNPRVLGQLAGIRQLGVDVAIDDFGTGYSNFSYLHEIPANVVKLDKSMITDMESNSRHQTIVRSVLQLARELGYRTVAEGVETFKCMQLIRALGCDEAQGFYFARPMQEQEFVGWSCASRFPLRKV